ncbi:MAG: cobalt-precorrin-5B (C(1))-methyltransferase [Firmicutes bacterium]|nr:cobalt-precorrin-5B (C(1))-methyltransferase [Bacillota bacterium]
MRMKAVSGMPRKARPGETAGRKLRYGYSTGTCAAAAARAAAICLRDGAAPAEVEVTLPGGDSAVIPIRDGGLGSVGLPGVDAQAAFPASAWASVIKDAGDDPDVTHGAEIRAEVFPGQGPGIAIEAGEGVGTVTKPGLGIPVGEPAVTAVPRRMITRALEDLLPGARVVVSVPEGLRLAEKTMNPRLGVVGGISILGTTGIVVPYSTGAYRASVSRALDVARASGCRKVVLTTGSRSDRAAQEEFGIDLPEEAFVVAGDFTGYAVKAAARKGFDRVSVWGMIGKISKLAAGIFQTHAYAGRVPFRLLADVASAAGAGLETTRLIEESGTARLASELIAAAGAGDAFRRLAGQAAMRLAGHAGEAVEVEVVIVGFDGSILAGSAGLGRSTVEL